VGQNCALLVKTRELWAEESRYVTHASGFNVGGERHYHPLLKFFPAKPRNFCFNGNASSHGVLLSARGDFASASRIAFQRRSNPVGM